MGDVSGKYSSCLICLILAWQLSKISSVLSNHVYSWGPRSGKQSSAALLLYSEKDTVYLNTYGKEDYRTTSERRSRRRNIFLLRNALFCHGHFLGNDFVPCQVPLVRKSHLPADLSSVISCLVKLVPYDTKRIS